MAVKALQQSTESWWTPASRGKSKLESWEAGAGLGEKRSSVSHSERLGLNAGAPAEAVLLVVCASGKPAALSYTSE